MNTGEVVNINEDMGRYDNLKTYKDGDRKGVFVVLEGIEGTGKTTLTQILKKRFATDQVDVVVTREPGGTPLAESIRRCIMEDEKISAVSELLLFMASRREHVSKIIYPGLKRGSIVLSDRYSLSTVAYQGYGRGLSLGEIASLNDIATGGVYPDITFIIDIDVDTSMDRKLGAEDVNRIDLMGRRFFEKVREGYSKQNSNLRNGQVIRINGEKDICEIADKMEGYMRKFLGNVGTIKEEA